MAQQHHHQDPLQPAQKPLLTVFTFDRDPARVYSYSGFCTKLRLRLRHAGVAYADAVGDGGTRQHAPKGKVPYVRFEESGELVGDSALIAERLVAEGLAPDVNAVLAPRERAADFCLRSMVEDRMYFYTVHERWIENTRVTRDRGPFGYLPAGVRHAAGLVLRGYCAVQLYFQGTGRHSAAEIRGLLREAVAAVAWYADAALARAEAGRRGEEGGKGEEREGEGEEEEEPFWILGGERPTEADFAVFGQLASLLASSLANPYTAELIREHRSLTAYVGRIHARYFPELESPV